MTSCCSSSRTRMPAPGSRRARPLRSRRHSGTGRCRVPILSWRRGRWGSIAGRCRVSTPRSSMRPSSRVPHANLVGTQSVARAAPDGYTFLFATSAALVMNPYTLKKLSYDPIKDFTPVAMVARSNHVVLVNPEVRAKTVAELIALEKSAPGSLSVAVDGPRNLSGLIAQSINKQAGTGFVLVPYNTTTNAIQDSIPGRCQAPTQAASIVA